MSYTLPPSVQRLLSSIDANLLPPERAETAIQQAGGKEFVQLAVIRKYLADAGGGGAPAFSAITGEPTDNTALAAALAAKGDMTKVVYDPQGLNVISGDSNSGNLGGFLNLDASSTSTGGNIQTTGGAAPGGDIDTRGGGTAGSAGGGLRLNGGSGNNAFGGSVITSGGGGMNQAGGTLDTTGTGVIELGYSGTRTTIAGAATSDRSIVLPDASGTAALTNQLSAIITGSGLTLDAAGFLALCTLFGITNFTQLLAAFSITPAADATITPVTSETTVSGVVTALS